MRFPDMRFALCVLVVLLCGFLEAAETPQTITFLPVATGPGSAEPRLSAGPGGDLVLSWLEPEGEATALRFAVLGASGWEQPRTVALGDDWFVNWADFPSVVPITGSLWAAHWLRRQPGSFYAYDVSIALSLDSGDTWSEPLTPHRDGTASEHGFVSLFPWQAGVGAVWLDGRNTYMNAPQDASSEAGGMTLRSAVISPDGRVGSEAQLDGLVCDCCQTDVALSTDGPVAVYRDRSKAEIRDVYVARSEGSEWQPGQPVADDGWKIEGCPVNGPAIAARNDDVAVAWFTMAEDVPRVRFARSTDGARTFGEAVDVAAGTPAGRVDVVLLGNGSAAVSWLDSEGTNQDAAIRVQVITPAGLMGEPYLIAPSEVTRPAGFPQLAVFQDSLIAAWTDASGDETRVRTARIDF